MGKMICAGAATMDKLLKRADKMIRERESVPMDEVDIKSVSLTYDERHEAWGLCVVYER